MAARYIDANLIRYKDLPFSANDEVGVYVGYSSKSQIDAIPTADVVEVKHGKWVSNENGYIHCTECLHPILLDGAEEYVYSPYCPHCGAKMGGKEGI